MYSRIDPTTQLLRLFLFDKVTRLKIPRHRWKPDPQSIQIRRHLNLTAQPRSLFQAKSQVQHVVLVIISLGHLVEHVVVVDDDVAC
jgi:hypothetical protein